MHSAESSEERWWRENLTGTSWGLRLGHSVLKHLPSDPRCKLCFGPFGGVGGLAMRAIGKGPWQRNPKYCSFCFSSMERRRGGAEIECSLLFADVRESTSLAEGMRPAEFRALMDRFFARGAQVLVDHDAVIDKFVGDEIFAFFVPAIAGERHAERAVSAARALVAATSGNADGPPVRVGAGIHSGLAFIGTVGEAPQLELTALGDAVNVAARLASAARAGEVLVTLQAAEAAGIDTERAERRELRLKGKSQPTPVLVLTVPAD